MAQRRGSRHISDLGDNNDKKQRQRNNDGHQEDSGVEELVSEIGSEVVGTVEGVRSGVVRGSCKSVLVTGLSIADVTTKFTTIATTHDNDDFDYRMTTMKRDEPRSTPAMWTSPHGEHSTVRVPDGVLKLKTEFVDGSGRAQLFIIRVFKAPVPAEVESGAEPDGMISRAPLLNVAVVNCSRAETPSDSFPPPLDNKDPGGREDRDLAKT